MYPDAGSTHWVKTVVGGAGGGDREPGLALVVPQTVARGGSVSITGGEIRRGGLPVVKFIPRGRFYLIIGGPPGA